MNKFKPGDIIIGNKYNGYGITCGGRKCIVVDTRDNENDICVRVHPSDWDPECERFLFDGTHICDWVSSDRFDLWEEQLSVPLSDFLTKGD